MDLINFDTLLDWGVPFFATFLGAGISFWLVGRAFAEQPSKRLYRQLIQVALVVALMIVLVLVMPFNVETRGQLLSLFGLVLTAVIALSSTTFVSNAMAGVTLKVIGSFHTGDFIRVADHFGRVTTKTLLHTEIQSEDRDTITLPNLFVITNPVKVVDQTGTLISADVTIGYDVDRNRVRDCLLDAAEAAGLTDPFTQILELGNFSVSYRVTGFLSDVSKIVSKRTELRAQMLDSLHTDGIEIMTPSVMDQRPIEPGKPVLPNHENHGHLVGIPPAYPSGKAEQLMFDKAELATRIERFRGQITSLEEEIKELEKDEEENALDIAWRSHQVSALKDFVKRVETDE